MLGHWDVILREFGARLFGSCCVCFFYVFFYLQSFGGLHFFEALFFRQRKGTEILSTGRGDFPDEMNCFPLLSPHELLSEFLRANLPVVHF